MGNIFKGALKVFVDYCISLIIFGIFLVTVISLAKDNFSFWLSIYSMVIFLLLAVVVYGDMKRLAVKEKRPQYNMNPFPIKGLILGLLGFLPFIILQLVYPFINFNDELADRLKSLTLSTLLGPMYFVFKIGGKTLTSYIAASALVPLLSMLGYIAGYYGFEFKKAKYANVNNNKK